MTVDSSFFKADYVSIPKEISWKKRKMSIIGLVIFISFIAIIPIWYWLNKIDIKS